MKLIAIILIFSSLKLFAQSDTVYTQSYIEKSTSFAWLTYGGDINYLTGGTTQVLNDGLMQNVNFGSSVMPRLTIGGIHFWGHADFYVTFPLSFLTIQNTPDALKDLEIYQGVETGLRLYPLKLAQGRLSPFAGISFRRVRFSQESVESSYGNGTPNYGSIIYPIQTGITYTSDKWHLTLSGYWNSQNSFAYFISPDQFAMVEIDPISFNLSFLRYVDTDRGMRNPRAVERINHYYKTLQNNNLLSSWFFAIGPSATLQMSKSPYLQENFPYFYDDYSASILPDVAFGRYFHQPDLNINLTYRTYADNYAGFDSEVNIRRHSIGVESVKFLFNWLGFVPFVGVAATNEHLQTTVNGIEHTKNELAFGIVFGWDIRVTQTGTSLLRTNLRYFPGLSMDVQGEKMMFDHLELNFIQWVQFIGRKKALRR